MKKLILVSIAWGEEFQRYATRLGRIASVLGLDCIIDHPEGEPENPLEAWKEKPRVIREVLGNGRPVLFLDVDSVIHRSIDALAGLECDVAAYCSRPGVYEDGVVLFQPTEKARAVLDLWDRYADRLRWKQKDDAGAAWIDRRWTNLALSAAIRELRPRVHALDAAYCWNEDWCMSERWPGVSPAIQPNAKETA